MTALCFLKCFKANAGIVIPLIIVSIGLFKCVYSISVASQTEDAKIEKLPFCDENLATERAATNR
jgi:hypothetical protein